MTAPHQLGEILLQRGLIVQDELARALRLQQQAGLRLGSNLLEMGVVNEERLLEALGHQHRIRTADGAALRSASTTIRRMVTKSAAVSHSVVPFSTDGNALWVASLDPLSLEAETEIAAASNRMLKTAIALELRVLEQLDRHFGLPLSERARNILHSLDEIPTQIARASTEEKMFRPLEAQEEDPAWIGMRKEGERRSGVRGPGSVRAALENLDPESIDEDLVVLEEDQGELVSGDSLEIGEPLVAWPPADVDKIEAIDDSDQIAGLLLDACAALFGKRALLKLDREQRAVGWVADGDGVDPQGVAVVELAISASRVLQQVLDSADPWSSENDDAGLADPAIQALANAIETSPDPSRVVPIAARRRVVGFLYLADPIEQSGIAGSRLPKIRPLVEALAERLLERLA